jgi:multiple sugar transport system permease protein
MPLIKNQTTRHALIAYAFLLPNIIGFLVFTLGPILYSFVISFFHWNIFSQPFFVDLDNYVKIFTSPDSKFWHYLSNTFFFLMSVPLQMGMALLLAVLLNQRVKGTTFFKVIYFVPVVVSVVSITMLWRYVFDAQNGLLNQLLVALGGPRITWLADPLWTKPAISMMIMWQSAAYSVIIYYAALQGIPDHLYEVARLDGAGWWRQFWRITFPLLAPSHFFLLITGFIGILQLFAPIYLVGAQDSTWTIIYEIYWKAYQEFEMGYAAALSWVLFIMIFIITAIQWRYIGKRVHYA